MYYTKTLHAGIPAFIKQFVLLYTSLFFYLNFMYICICKTCIDTIQGLFNQLALFTSRSLIYHILWQSTSSHTLQTLTVHISLIQMHFGLTKYVILYSIYWHIIHLYNTLIIKIIMWMIFFSFANHT